MIKKILSGSLIFISASSMAYADQVLSYKLTWDDTDQRYHVFMKASATPVPNLTTTAQVTIKVPHLSDADRFQALQVTSAIPGTMWIGNSRIDAPTEDPEYDYLSFSLTMLAGPSGINWQQGVEQEVFNFVNSGNCTAPIALLNNQTDPFAIPNNSASTNPGNQYSNLGWGAVGENNYLDNYQAEADCRVDSSEPEPPVDEPPVDEPPVDEPPVDEPPVNEPPVITDPPETGGCDAGDTSCIDENYDISVVSKDNTHPEFGNGSNFGFEVNGTQGKELVLEKGKTYTFTVSNSAGHPLYISTDPTGAGAGIYDDGVTGAPTENGTITFTPSADAPDTLYYQCMNHPNMGWKINIIDNLEDGVPVEDPSTEEPPVITDPPVNEPPVVEEPQNGGDDASGDDSANNEELDNTQADANNTASVLDYKVAWSDADNQYHVFMKPSITPTPTDLSMTGQITLKVPHGTGADKFSLSDIANNITGVTWTLASRIDAPQEDPTYDYLSFVFTSSSPQAFQWQANQEKEMFSFSNTANCLGGVTVMPSDDPFNTTQNSASTNPGNQFTNLGWGDASSNNYHANYGDSADACNIDQSPPDTAVLDYKVEWNEADSKYHVFMKPSATPNPVDLSMTGQITLKVPHGEGNEKFEVSDLSSVVTGTDWSLASHVAAPQEAANYDYLSFIVTLSNAQAFQWQADQEIEVFSFSNASSCLGDVAVMASDDPFNVPQNSTSTNPGNQFTNLGWGDASSNNYHGNYGDANASCTIDSAEGDNDLVPNIYESAEEDRDNDGISDKEDFDPTGYLYCVNTGKILAGGSIAVEGPGNINIVSNGSTGYYQFTMDTAGEYKMHIVPPAGSQISTQYPASNAALDPTGQDNPYVLGSGEYTNTGRLSNPSPARNTPWFNRVVVESGDPFVINNNIPLEGSACGDDVIDGGEGQPDDQGHTFKAIPTLSEWAQILLALLVSVVAGRGLMRKG